MGRLNKPGNNNDGLTRRQRSDLVPGTKGTAMEEPVFRIVFLPDEPGKIALICMNRAASKLLKETPDYGMDNHGYVSPARWGDVVSIRFRNTKTSKW